jgi:hypothetical protein
MARISRSAVSSPDCSVRRCSSCNDPIIPFRRPGAWHSSAARRCCLIRRRSAMLLLVSPGDPWNRQRQEGNRDDDVYPEPRGSGVADGNSRQAFPGSLIGEVACSLATARVPSVMSHDATHTRSPVAVGHGYFNGVSKMPDERRRSWDERAGKFWDSARLPCCSRVTTDRRRHRDAPSTRP